jgi:hypothetical protein
LHQAVKAELCQQRQEQEQPGDACPDPQRLGAGQDELPAIGDGGDFFLDSSTD